MRKIFCSLLSIVALSILMAQSALALGHTPNNSYAKDYAGLLSEETEAYIQEQSLALDNATRVQIVVVTVENLDGLSVEEYATRLFRELGLGDSDKNNGLLILLSRDDRKLRVEVGYGLEGALPDGKVGSIQDEYMVPYLSEDKFDEGLLNGYKAYYRVVADEYNLETDVSGVVVSSDSGDDDELLSLLVMFAIFVPILVPLWKRRTIGLKAAAFVFLEIGTAFWSAVAGYNGIQWWIVAIVGTLASLLRAISNDEYSSGGRSSGWSIGSLGGSSSSGGSSGFSGHGGSSGGGGASRSF